MKLYSTLKTYIYKSEDEQALHQKIMEQKGYRLWLKEWVGNRLCCDYVKQRKNGRSSQVTMDTRKKIMEEKLEAI